MTTRGTFRDVHVHNMTVNGDVTYIKNRGSGADDDVLGKISFNGDDSGGTSTEFVKLEAKSTDVTDADEAGELTLTLFNGGLNGGTAAATPMLRIGGEDTANSVRGGIFTKTFVYTSAVLGTNSTGWAENPATVNISEHNGIVETIVFLDLAEAECDAGGTVKDVLGKVGGLPGYFIQLQKEINGYIFHASMTCVEAATGSIDEDIDLVANTNSINGSDAFDGAGTSIILVTAGGDWTIGTSIGVDLAIATSTAGLDNNYLYLAAGNDGGTATNAYGAGKFIIKLLGVACKPDGSAF